jgi:hypothetical protein
VVDEVCEGDVSPAGLYDRVVGACRGQKSSDVSCVGDTPSHRVTMRTLWAVAAFSFGAKMWSIKGQMLRGQRQIVTSATAVTYQALL